MEKGKIIGYAKIKPSKELDKLLNDSSYSIVNSDIDCSGPDETCRDCAQECKGADNISYNHIIKLLKRQGINLTPEEAIRTNARGLIGTFEVHELKFSDYFGMEGQDGQNVDKIISFTEKYLGHTGMMYILHPISDYNPGMPMLAGELECCGQNLYPLSVRDFLPTAIVTKGITRVGARNRLFYGTDVFSITPIPMDFKP